MDPVDIKILGYLQEDGRKPHSDIAKEVRLSAPSVSERVKKLSKEGIIKRYTAILDPRKLKKEMTAFINVSISNPKYERGFVESVLKLEDVQECHHITGQYSYLLKVRVKNSPALEELLSDRIRSIDGVVSTLTNVVLSSVKEETKINLDSFVT